MAEVALTEIKYGKDDGTVEVIPEGAKVDHLPKEIKEQLRETESIGEPALTQADKDAEKDELLDRIADLQRQLQETKEKREAPATPNPPETKPAPAAKVAK